METVRNIKEINIKKDATLGLRFAVVFSELYTKIIVGKRVFFFNAETGNYDGTGTEL